MKVTEILRGRGASKAQFFKGKYDAKLDFPRVGGGIFKLKKPSMGGGGYDFT